MSITRRAFSIGAGLVGAQALAVGRSIAETPAGKTSKPTWIEIDVPAGYPAESIVHRIEFPSDDCTARTVESSGVRVEASGDVYLLEAERRMPARAFAQIEIVQGEAVVGSQGVRLKRVDDYLDLSDWRENISFWIDASDNRYLLLTEDAMIEEIADKGAQSRAARNDLYPDGRPRLAPSETIGQALEFRPTDRNIYGLFFPDAPLFSGVQRLQVSNRSLQIRLEDQYFDNVPSQEKSAKSRVPTVAIQNLQPDAPTLLTIEVAADGKVAWWANGTKLKVDKGTAPDLPSLTFALVHLRNADDDPQIWSSAALGQAYVWKGASFSGEIYEIVTILGAQAN